ncbi:MAG: lipopolysaccharide biosynthesis protein [Muribaculaceae bacterium]|nr:lipopolysaccharide biosynthesis protein [Muribaculaceae bacterium]
MSAGECNDSDLKMLTARSVKWNMIDRVASIMLYTLIGIVLARELDSAEFGLVGTVLMFQAFASLFVDSGFSYALIQRKQPSRLDYSTVLWFNLGVAVAVYVLLWIASPAIAWWYDEPMLVWLGRLTFLSFIFNAASIVQTNRLMKQKNVAPIALANTVGLIAGGIIAVWLAVTLPPGRKVWAVVWQTNVLNLVRCLVLWIYTRWLPLMRFSWPALKSFFGVGGSMMSISLLNTVFQNIYTFVIGTFTGMSKLGYYTQADKWSKMGVASLTQVVTSSFLPTLSDVQDDDERFARASVKMNRAGSYMLIACMGMAIAVAGPLFHALFGEKWDLAVPLFQILLLRGVFTSMTSLYNNYVIALGRPRMIVSMELVRDITAGVALAACLPFIDMARGDNMLWGIELLLWGQLFAAVVAWAVTVWYVAPMCGRTRVAFIADSLPYVGITAVTMGGMWLSGLISADAWIQLGVMSLVGVTLYVAINAVAGSQVQRDLFAYLLKRR